MSRSLLVLEGRPESLRVLAEALTGGAARLSAVNSVLLQLQAGARWESESGHAFEAAVQAPPPVIAAVVERYAGAARALRTLADELEVAQREVAEAMESHRDAWRRHDAFMQRRDVAVDPVEQQDLERAMNAEIAVVDGAERRHARAVHRHTEADHACARALRGLARDVLDDPTAYSVLVGTGTVSGPMAMVGGLLPGQLKLVGVAGAAAGTSSRLGLLVFYDEGSWKEIGVNLVATGVTSFGSVLVAGSAVGAKVVVEGGRRAFTKIGNPTTRLRLSGGARTWFDDWVRGWRTKVGLPVQPRPVQIPARPLPRATSLTGKTRNAATRAVDSAVLDSWRMATASGREAQRMFVAGMTLKQAPKLARQVDGIHGRLTTPPTREGGGEGPESDLSLSACPSPDPSSPTGAPSTPRG